MSDFRYPNESSEYRVARNELLEAEIALRAQIEAVAAKRRALPRGGALKSSYQFTRMRDGGEESVPFEALFDGHSSLIVYSMMFGAHWDAPCPSCTSIVDAISTAALTIGAHHGIAVVADASAEQMQKWQSRRNWQDLPVASAHGTDFLIEYAGFGDCDDPALVSALNVFTRSDEGIFHFWGSELAANPMDNGHPRHVDMIWPLWNLLDTVPEGRGEAIVPRQNFEHRYFSEHVLGIQEDAP